VKCNDTGSLDELVPKPPESSADSNSEDAASNTPAEEPT